VLEVFGEIDRGHAARAELALDAVTVGQDKVELFGSGAQGFSGDQAD
jgi:hypothetical protein